MEPGRELDALVSEKVFGILVPEGDIGQKQLGPFPQGDETYEWGINTMVRDGGRLWYYRGPKYSTKIEAAWEVVEKLDLTFELGWLPTDKGLNWDASFGEKRGSEEGTTTYAKTAPHAICLAALKIME